MHEKQANPTKNRVPMIRTHSHKQLPLSEFDWSFQVALDENNRWVKMSQCIPWDELAEGYYQSLSTTQGRPAKDARLVIGAVIIKHKLCLSDEETVQQIQENPYLQYFVGLPGYQMKAPFGAKLSVSLTGGGLACVDRLRWDAFHEGGDLKSQVEAYKVRYGVYPEAVLGDPVYGTRDNRCYLKSQGIRFAGKPLGRPRKVTEANREELKRLKAQRREEYLQRIPIEGKFGQGKQGYGLNYIPARRADTSAAWINSIFLVMNLLILLRIFFTLIKRGVAGWLYSLIRGVKGPFTHCVRNNPASTNFVCQIVAF